jgi:putative membrane protein
VIQLVTTGLEVGPAPWRWTLDPLQILPIAAMALAYGRRARTLARRGRAVSPWRQLSFYAGLGVLLVALVSPIDTIGEDSLLFVHMLQHILIGDFAALLVVAGLTGPLLRPLLALPLVGRLRVFTNPLVALPLWALDLYLWHLPPAYGAALGNDAVHALQHICFFVFGAFMWAALLEPLPGPAWFGSGFKALYVIAVRFVYAVLANIFIWSSSAFYPHYVHAARLWGISPVSDQNAAGAIMLLEGTVLTFGVLAWIFLRWMAEGERAQQLVERGVDPRTAERAVRYGRAGTLG